ncbi:MAG TPA: hypothetical protein VGD22_03925 [Sphingobacteriaceae bacterium]
MLTTSKFSGFDFEIDQISKFLSVLDFFTIMLKDGRIVHFTPSCVDSFRNWLVDNNITDIGKEST